MTLNIRYGLRKQILGITTDCFVVALMNVSVAESCYLRYLVS